LTDQSDHQGACDAPTTSSSSPSRPTRQAPDFKQIRKYLKDDDEHAGLDQFIAEGWTAAELGELARQWRPSRKKTYPTPQAYRDACLTKGGLARDMLRMMREPGYVLPPFDRPDPIIITEDDPENPEHSAETRADVETLARLLMARADDSRQRPRRGPEVPVSKRLWKGCFHELKRYNGLERAIDSLDLREYCA
jgi:hypothetical protein